MTKYRSPQLAQKKKKEFWIKTGLIAYLIIVAFLCLSSLFKLHFINIKEIYVKGDETIDISLINNVIKEELTGNYFWKFFPKRNILIYPKKTIETKLMENHSQIKEINFDLNKLTFLNIDIKERQPFSLWCDVIEDKEECLLMDDESYIFEGVSEEGLFKYYVKIKEEDPLRQSVFSLEKFKEINSFLDFMRGLDLKPYKLTTNGLKGYEIYFDDGGKIIFSEDQEVRVVMENLQSVINLEDVNLSEIDYIDLRFGNKVFYK